MVKRKIQFQNGSYFTVIPGALIDALGLRPGDKVSFGIENGKIEIVPVPAAQVETGTSQQSR